MHEHQLPGLVALLVAGPSTRNPDANYRLEFLNIGELPSDSSIGGIEARQPASVH
jgi:hypothetical protein